MLRNCGKWLDFWNEESNTEPTPFFKWDCKEKTPRATCLDKKQGAPCKKFREEMWGIFLILLYNHSNLHATFKQKHHEVMVVSIIIVKHFFRLNLAVWLSAGIRLLGDNFSVGVLQRWGVSWGDHDVYEMQWNNHPLQLLGFIGFQAHIRKGLSSEGFWQPFNNVQRFKACDAQIPEPFMINKF